MTWKSAPYYLIGDDIIIGNDSLYYKYIEALEMIGVTYNESKTHNSKHLFEFAKRIIYKGKEITPFAISSLVGQGANFYTLASVLLTEQRKS